MVRGSVNSSVSSMHDWRSDMDQARRLRFVRWRDYFSVRRFRHIFHPMGVFVIAQVSWGLLMFIWIRWYVKGDEQAERIMNLLPAGENFVVAAEANLLLGSILMGICLVGFYVVFLSLRRQISLNKMHNSIVDNVTHELKTPVASIRLCTETLLLRELDKQKRTRFLNHTLMEVDRLQRLIDGVLVSAKFQDSTAVIDLEEADVIPVIDQAWERMVQRIGDSRELTLIKSINGLAEGEFIFAFNVYQLGMLFDNLLDNAVKYSSDGDSITLHVETSLRSMFVRVSDTGMGIEKRELKRIFRKFARAKNSEKKSVSGTGLGLFVCRSIVQRHCGRIFATSEGLNRGASFHVEFRRTGSAR